MRDTSRVKLTTLGCYEVDPSEKRRAYTTLALMQYYYECDPEYNENKVLRRLYNDFERYNQEIIKISDLDPNNLALNGIRNYISRNLGILRTIIKESGERE